MMTLGQVHAMLRGSRLVGDPATPILRVHTDTRTLQAGDLFVALRGERFDANDFLAQAKQSGAVAAIAERGLAAAGLAGVEVADSRATLGALATAWRAQHAVPLIAVTGSNGKTTLTQMIASILRAWQGEAALATQGNFNNDIGVPLTLLRLRPAHRVAVVELGMNHPGEIAQLAAMAQPMVAVVNNAQREHQEFMATVEAVAQENGAVLAALPADGIAVFPADAAYTPLWRGLAGVRKVLTFGAAHTELAGAQPEQLGDVFGSAIWHQGAWAVQAQTPAGTLHFPLHIAGRHNVKNAMAAIACALAVDVPASAIEQGLATFEPVKGRSRAFSVRLAGQEITVVDDTYNANPDSVRAAIDVLAELPGPRLLVLGDMGEVGDQGPAFHAEAGAYASAKNIEKLLCAGVLASFTASNFVANEKAGRHFSDMTSLLEAVQKELPGMRSVLVKGSRFMKMERVVDALSVRAQQEKEESSHVA